ncbi:MAG: hypothetical protein BJ554DRAFT_1939 [Olpidium bornovanus]|uniref:Uncharacterized protein n=1 Tax=Olpidium bornovanus TaxID=278681 RepID=A0A8H7ZR95_9FUNG|nr:MAG: hypothetical protein BJ554DRAFT_1939 [Olpidium bornovanus]
MFPAKSRDGVVNGGAKLVVRSVLLLEEYDVRDLEDTDELQNAFELYPMFRNTYLNGCAQGANAGAASPAYPAPAVLTLSDIPKPPSYPTGPSPPPPPVLSKDAAGARSDGCPPHLGPLAVAVAVVVVIAHVCAFSIQARDAADHQADDEVVGAGGRVRAERRGKGRLALQDRACGASGSPIPLPTPRRAATATAAAAAASPPCNSYCGKFIRFGVSGHTQKRKRDKEKEREREAHSGESPVERKKKIKMSSPTAQAPPGPATITALAEKEFRLVVIGGAILALNAGFVNSVMLAGPYAVAVSHVSFVDEDISKTKFNEIFFSILRLLKTPGFA